MTALEYITNLEANSKKMAVADRIKKRWAMMAPSRRHLVVVESNEAAGRRAGGLRRPDMQVAASSTLMSA